jgi:hypothetical protein
MKNLDDFTRLCDQGMKAWGRLKRDRNWRDWLVVGDALLALRTQAMHQAGTNRPEGKGYNFAFSQLLQDWKLDDMDKGARSRLFQVIDNLPAIEEWRATLTLTERLQLNHPGAVLRKWKKTVEPAKEGKEPKPTTKDELIKCEEEIERLKAHNEEQRATLELPCPHCGKFRGADGVDD